MLSKVKGHLSYANVMATVAAFAAIGGGAVAIGGVVTPDGQIQACYDRKGKDRGEVRLLVRGKCTRGEKPIAWNEQGPPGDPGDPGPAGAPGSSAEALQTVLAGDGPGSGLNADLLDGQDSTAFLRTTGGTVSGLLTLGAGARANAGSETAPAYSFSGDSNTGLYSSAANTLGLTASGSIVAVVKPEGLEVLDGYLRVDTTNSPSPTSNDCNDLNNHPGRMLLSVNGFNPADAVLYVCDNDVGAGAGAQPGWIAVNP